MHSNKSLKKAIRLEMLKKRCLFNDLEYEQKSTVIVDLIKNSKEFQKAGNILFFASKGREVNLFPLIELILLNSAKHLLLPCLGSSSGVMYARSIAQISQLIQGKFGILEPPSDCKIINPDQIDLILVPALAVDHFGYRIGYGGGYYDRYLFNTNAFKMAVVFSCQIVDCLIMEDHDLPVDAIVSEKGLTYIENRLK